VYDVAEPDVEFILDAPDEVTIGDDFTIYVELKVGKIVRPITAVTTVSFHRTKARRQEIFLSA
jgi:ribosome-associated translation inhibitor RaiA